MLVLTRKSGQKLIIANDVVVTVLETRGDTVKLGIEAPKTVSIYREELWNDILQANQQAQAENVMPNQLHPLKTPAQPSGNSPKGKGLNNTRLNALKLSGSSPKPD